MNNDERYIQNIRNTLIARVNSVRVDAGGNLMNLAVLSEDFYCGLLNILFDCRLHNANADKRNAAGIDLIDEESHIAAQVSVTYTHEKMQSSINKFVRPDGEKWRFYFIPIVDKLQTPKRGFNIPHWLAFDKEKDILHAARIMELIQHTDIEKKRRISNYLDQYAKHQELCEGLRSILLRTRDAHPSFVLLRRDGIDKRLFPHAAELREFTMEGRTEADGPVSPVWDIIRGSWSTNRNIVIEGAGGIGKTVTLFSVTNDTDSDMPPAVYVPMHRLVDENGNCVDLTDHLKKIHNEIPDLAQMSRTDRPALLVLLDGFNEVPANMRRTILHLVNDWYVSNPGAQLIAVSRPMDGMNLKTELQGDPLPITLEPLSRDTVREYLGDRTPEESSPVWDVLTRPLFLNLYIKTGELEGRTSDGYPLKPKPPVSGGALIWNYLQRELLREEREQWVLRCAVACEYILPYIACVMEQKHWFDIDCELAEELVAKAVKNIDPKKLPNHLKDFYKRYRKQHHKYPDLNSFNWLDTVFTDVDILVSVDYKDEIRYKFIHQNFRDALAGLYLVNQAEMMDKTEPLPEVWQRAANHYVMDYAAELMDEDEADKLWEANRTTQPTNSAATYAMMELQRRRFDGKPSKLNFSGMDLREISLARYMRDGGEGEQDKRDMKLFRDPNLSKGTQFAESTFKSPGHTNSVTCVGVTEDDLCVSGSWDNTLLVWDIRTGECLRTMEGHTSSVTCVAVTEDGLCVSGSDDSTLRVWDIRTGECLRTMDGHTDPVNCVALTENGLCVSGSADKTLRLWDIYTGECLRTMVEHTESFLCVAVTEDGLCVSGSSDNTLRVWDIHTGECLCTMKGHTGSVFGVAVAEDGLCVSGSTDNTLRVWDIYTGECIRTMVEHTDWVNCVAVIRGGLCVSGSGDRTLRVWDIRTGKCLSTMKGHTDWVRCVTVTEEGKCVSGSDDRTIRVWDIHAGHNLRTMAGHTSLVNCVAITEDGQCVSGSRDGRIRLWDIRIGECLQILEGHTHWVNCAAVTTDGLCVSGSDDNTLQVWDIRVGECLRTLEGHTDWVRCVALTEDGLCVSGSDDKTLRVWDIRTGECLRTMEGHTDRVNCVAVTEDGLCVSGAHDNTLRVWDIRTGECLRTMKGHTDGVNCVAVKENGLCVSGSFDKTLRVWDIYSGRCLSTMVGDTDVVRCVAVTEDGLCVSGSVDNTLRVWDIHASQCLRSLEGHTGSINCVDVTKDGLYVSGSKDSTIRLWDIRSGKCIDVFYSMEIDAHGMDYTGAKLPPELAKPLVQNGAKISPSDYDTYVKNRIEQPSSEN